MNPFRLIRRKLRLAQSGIPGISDTTVQRIEIGQYEELSDGMIDALVQAVEAKGTDFSEIAEELQSTYGTPYLTEAYQKWRISRRKSFGDRAEWPDLDQLDQSVSPMHAFIAELSGTLYRFCTDLCVQGPTVERYARGEYAYDNPPESLQEAFEQAGYTERNKLFSLQRKWIDGDR